MNREFDPLDDLAADFARREPPPMRAGLEDELLEAFSRETAPVRALRVRRVAAVLVAAAAVLVAAVLLFSGATSSIERLAGREAGAVADLLERIERLRAEIGAIDVGDASLGIEWTESGDAETATPLDRVASRALAAAGDDPALLRLITARTNEVFDREVAVRDYRELLRDYPESPACEPARARLDALSR